MIEITLNADIRTNLGRSSANTARHEGRIPGVFYLHDEKNIPIVVKALDLRPLVYTDETHIVNLNLSDGTNHKCVIKEVQFDPVTDNIIHFDLMGFSMSEKVRVEVPVVLHGNALGVREGGVLNHILHKVEIECLASKLPEHITVDITDMKVGDVLKIGDLPLIDATVIHLDAEVPVATIVHGRGEVIPVEEIEESAEPELIPRGKAETEEA